MFSLPSPLQRQNADGSSKGPYVEVILQAIGDNPKQKDRTFKLDGSIGFIRVGRANSRVHDNQSPLDDNCYIDSPIVSRQHARFLIGDKSRPILLCDEGSTHGTFIDNVRLPIAKLTAVENGAIIKFGEEVVHGSLHYFPSMFQVSFTWHTPLLADAFRPAALRQKFLIQAPMPAIDTEDEEDDTTDAETPLPTTAFPTSDTMNSSNYIDLTDEPEIEIREASADETRGDLPQEKQHVPVAISLIHDDDDDDEGREPDQTANGTTVVTTPIKRFYRYEYDNSDPEEEAELTSQGSPHQDYNSLYDNTDDSDVPDSPSFTLEGPEMLKPAEPSIPEQDDPDTLHQPRDNYESEIQEDQRSARDSSASSFDSEDRDLISQVLEDISDSETSESEPSPTGYHPPEYEEALAWLDLAPDSIYTAHQIVDLAEAKIAADQDDEGYTLECVTAIADGSSDRKVARTLEAWIDSGGEPLQPEKIEVEVEVEVEREYEPQNNPFVSPLPTTSAVVPSSSVPNRNGFPEVNLENPHAGMTASTHAGAFGDIESLSRNEPYQIPDSFAIPRNSISSFDFSTGEIASNSVMRISNLLDTTIAAAQQGAPGSTAVRFSDELKSSFGFPNTESYQSSGSSVYGLMGPFAPYPESIAGLRQQGNLAVTQEQQTLNEDAVCTGHKRKLDSTEFEKDEEYNTAPDLRLSESGSMSLSETFLQDAQVPSQQPVNHNDSAEVQTLTQTTTTIDIPERDRPSKHKRRQVVSRQRPGFVKTLATHFAAGALGAFGVVAAIVATTPLSLQEELLLGNP